MATVAQDVAMLLNDAAHQRRKGRIIQALNSVRLARAIRLDTSLKASCEQLRNIVSRNAAFVASLASTLPVKLVKVDVWPNGYADDKGVKTITIPESANLQNEAIKAFGFMARVAGFRTVRHAAPVSQAAAMAYTRRDNT